MTTKTFYWLALDGKKLFDPYPPIDFPWLWWSVGAFIALMVAALLIRWLARRQQRDRALKLQLRLTATGLIWWSLGGLVLAWLRNEAIPWLGMSVLLPLYGLLVVFWLIYSWWTFRYDHQKFLAKIKTREERWQYLPGGKKHKR